jgi:beta-glucosidase
LQFPDTPGVPKIALRGFCRIHLGRGERRAVEFRLSPRDLGTVSPQGETRIVAGTYRVFVGGGQPGTAPASNSTTVDVVSSALLSN